MLGPNGNGIEKTTTTEALLGMLSLRAMSGYEIRRTIEMSIGNFWNESFGQIYPALAKLRRQGLVEVEESGRAGRKVYSLTAAGLERLKEWLAVAPVHQKPRNEVLLKLFFGSNGQIGDLREQVIATREKFAADLLRYTLFEPELKRMRAGHPGLPYFLMTLSFGMAEARAGIQWADETLGKLDELSMEKMHEEER